MRIVRIAVVGSCLLLAGCATSSGIREAFELSSREYNRMLRWKEMDEACAAFSDAPLVKECRERGAALRDVSMADLRIRNTEYRGEKTRETATVRVEIDYFVLPSGRVKTAEYLEQWAFRDLDGRKRWCITTLPPELK
jgi:hypothetical protein